MSPSSILTIAHNLFRQFLNVTFNKIVCQLVLFLFYETPPPDLLSSLLLVLLAGYFGFQVSARQLSAESVRGARFQAPEQLWAKDFEENQSRKRNNIIEFKKIQLDGNRWLFWCSGFMPVLFSDNAGTKACIGSWKNLFKAQLSNALPN